MSCKNPTAKGASLTSALPILWPLTQGSFRILIRSSRAVMKRYSDDGSPNLRSGVPLLFWRWEGTPDIIHPCHTAAILDMTHIL